MMFGQVHGGILWDSVLLQLAGAGKCGQGKLCLPSPLCHVPPLTPLLMPPSLRFWGKQSPLWGGCGSLRMWLQVVVISPVCLLLQPVRVAPLLSLSPPVYGRQ